MYKRNYKEIFLDNLPKWENGKNKGKINWKKSIGYKVKFIYNGIKGEVEIIDYQSPNLQIKYLNNNIYKISYSTFSKCKFERLLNKYLFDFKINIGTIIKDVSRDLIIIDREKRTSKNGQIKKYYKYKCNKCGYDNGWLEESHLLHKQGCSCCCKYNATTVLGINTIWDTDRWMCNLGVSEEDAKNHTKYSDYKIYPICPHCGRRKNKAIKICEVYVNKSIGCSCSDNISFPNKLMYSILGQLNINFMSEYSPKWIGRKRYDFYISSKNLIVEMDGGWHNKDNTFSKQTKNKSKEIDSYKDKMAREHNIEVIRINCDYDNVSNRFKYIKSNIINSKLNIIFDLSKINWNKCEEFALSNLIKGVCEAWNNNPEYTIKNLANLFMKSESTIRNWLRQGEENGWCNYDCKIKNSKKIKIFKNNICLGTFNSVKELYLQSKTLFGIQFNKQKIYDVCNNKRPHHYNYYFRYV